MAGDKAKKSTIIVKLVSTAKTGYYYVTRKKTRSKTGEPVPKLKLMKYDPKIRKTVEFVEKNISK